MFWLHFYFIFLLHKLPPSSSTSHKDDTRWTFMIYLLLQFETILKTSISFSKKKLNVPIQYNMNQECVTQHCVTQQSTSSPKGHGAKKVSTTNLNLFFHLKQPKITWTWFYRTNAFNRVKKLSSPFRFHSQKSLFIKINESKIKHVQYKKQQ